jgi:hypothetical protein
VILWYNAPIHLKNRSLEPELRERGASPEGSKSKVYVLANHQPGREQKQLIQELGLARVAAASAVPAAHPKEREKKMRDIFAYMIFKKT